MSSVFFLYRVIQDSVVWRIKVLKVSNGISGTCYSIRTIERKWLEMKEQRLMLWHKNCLVREKKKILSDKTSTYCLRLRYFILIRHHILQCVFVVFVLMQWMPCNLNIQRQATLENIWKSKMKGEIDGGKKKGFNTNFPASLFCLAENCNLKDSL